MENGNIYIMKKLKHRNRMSETMPNNFACTEHEKREEVLENDLHQQYAENDNNRIGVFTSFIIGIVALFGFYGYVFVNTNSREYWNFNMQEYLLMSFITIGILFFLAILALYFGYSLRRDHFIVYKIRRKRYSNEKRMEEIFGKLYNPLEKSICSFIPNFYNMFYCLFLISELFIFFTTVLKINNMINNGISFCENKGIIFIIMPFHIIFIISTFLFRWYYYKKYKRNIYV